jgi:tryptophan halogenase
MKIVIAGGGTAGWLAAFTLHKSNPNKHEIIVVESEKIGIIGAGEATSGVLYDLLSGNMFGNDADISSYSKPFDFDHFMKEVGGIPKYALEHINWAKDKGSYWAPIEGSETFRGTPDYLFNYAIAEFGVEKAYLSSRIGQSYSLNKMPNGAYGFQFDGLKVGKYIKKYLLENTKTTSIDAIIMDSYINPKGLVENIVLDNGQTVYGDFFIDSSGFAKVISKKIDMGWVSYKDCLLVDRAMPFLTPYAKDEKIKPVTQAYAMSSGWIWRTPTRYRKGNGYVYNSQFISDEDAKLEAEKLVGHEIEPIKFIQYDSGRVQEFWKGNVLTVGLAGSFLEPLEATSIHGTILQLYTFCSEYLTKDIETTLNPASIKNYNKKTVEMYEYYKDFTVLHYQGGREDSEFWRHIKNEKITTPVVEDYIEKSKSKIASTLYFSDYWNTDSIWKWSLAGLGFVTQKQALDELLDANIYEYSKQHYEYFTHELRHSIQDNDSFETDVSIYLNELK